MILRALRAPISVKWSVARVQCHVRLRRCFV